jgi:hypothetical protein
MRRNDLGDEGRAWLAIEAILWGELADAALVPEVSEEELAAVDGSGVDAAWVARMQAEADAMLDARWRELLANAKERRAARPHRAPAARREMPRAEMLARLDELRGAYPALALHHRGLGEMPDEMLRVLVEDIEAVIDDGDE